MLNEELLNTILQDDETPYGGTAFANETLRDFLEEIGIDEFDSVTLEDANFYLQECGIATIKEV